MSEFSSPNLHVTLYVRDDLPEPAVAQTNAVERRAAGLESSTHIEGVDCETWPKRIPTTGETEIEQQYRHYRDWATRVGVDLQPFFQTRQCYSKADGSLREWLVLPVLCLTVSAGESLLAVYPHTTESVTNTVADGIRALEENALEVAGEKAADWSGQTQSLVSR